MQKNIQKKIKKVIFMEELKNKKNKQLIKLSFINFMLLFFVFNLSFGQMKFILKNDSKIYNAEIIIDCLKSNYENECMGHGRVKLINKATKTVIQTFPIDNFFYSDKNRDPSVNIIELPKGRNGALVFGDFNFDGTEDLAIGTGTSGVYGGALYAVYLSNLSQTKFLISDEFTTLANDNLGMFETDSKRKRIIAYSKSGCCWHEKREYIVVPKKGLKLVYSLEEDGASAEGKFMTVTTK